MSSKKKILGNDKAVGSSSPSDDAVASRSSVGSGGIPYCDWSDLDLVACLAEESGDAYAELYRRHAASVKAAARMILVNDERCQDVVAEVFVGLWFFPNKFDPSRGSLLAFLRLKARGRSIDIVRSETARTHREGSDRRANDEYGKDLSAVMIGAESALAVREALALLPRNESEPIYLAFFSGLAYSEVARRLKLPEGTVKSRIRSGLRRLGRDDGLSRLHAVDDVDDVVTSTAQRNSASRESR